ncbi:hypothetical protein GCM10009554_43140 [Kribbella koreensis]|uniref:DNA primase DNAG catalytic core N-terminal domain-containing protein n=2 Tax=Kribbella koreensis TaxID=57909 RepID=A0ABN1QSG9_9ACTN
MTVAERARLGQVNRVAREFFRHELRSAEDGWAARSLRQQGAEMLLDPAGRWAVGYAPGARSRLVGYLRSCGFALESMTNAGLTGRNAEGRAVDRFRDLPMFPAKNERLETVGFIGISQAGNYEFSPETQLHRRATSLVGVAEQQELLIGGGAPVLVADPMDAIAITHVSLLSAGRWVGIPMFGADLSPVQMRILGRYAATDHAIVVLPDTTIGRRQAERSLRGLGAFFPRVQAVELPRGTSPNKLRLGANGLQRLHDALLETRPLSDYRRAKPRADMLERYAEVEDTPLLDP